MKPPTVGAITGPRKLAAEKRASGTDRLSCGQISVMDPPELVTVGDPKNPEKKRKTIIEATFGASAHPIWNRTNSPRTTRKIVLRPQTSDRGANSRGPDANPKGNVVIPSVATVDEQPYACEMDGMAAV